MYALGERVNVAGYETPGVITRVDVHDPWAAYQVQFDGYNYSTWVATGDVTLAEGVRVTLTPEQAARVREALEALGWDDEDMGPLAAPPTPKKVIKATITLPDDALLQDALDNIEAETEQWLGNIEFEA